MKLLVIGKEGRLANLSSPERMTPYEITYCLMGTSTADLLKAGSDADLLLVDAMGKVPGDLIRGMKHLRLIQSEGVGYQGVDVKTAAELGIPVCNCKGMNATPVAEHAVMLMLACLRDMPRGRRGVLEGRQLQVKEAHMQRGDLRELADCTVGLLGFGDIGRETARLLSAFGARCLYFSRHQVPEEEARGAEYVPLEELLERSDILSLHVPVTDETRGMADAAFFSRMKRGAILVNTSRGELADTRALLEALRCGQLSMAGLDCAAGEPIGPDNPLITESGDVRECLVLTPHIAGVTASSFRRGYAMVWDNMDAAARGLPLRNVVNGVGSGT